MTILIIAAVGWIAFGVVYITAWRRIKYVEAEHEKTGELLEPYKRRAELIEEMTLNAETVSKKADFIFARYERLSSRELDRMKSGYREIERKYSQ